MSLGSKRSVADGLGVVVTASKAARLRKKEVAREMKEKRESLRQKREHSRPLQQVPQPARAGRRGDGPGRAGAAAAMWRTDGDEGEDDEVVFLAEDEDAWLGVAEQAAMAQATNLRLSLTGGPVGSGPSNGGSVGSLPRRSPGARNLAAHLSADRLADDLYDLALADGASDEALAAAAEAAALAGYSPSSQPHLPTGLGEFVGYESGLYGAGAHEKGGDDAAGGVGAGDSQTGFTHSQTGFTLTSGEMNMTSAERLVAVGMERLASGLNRLHGAPRSLRPRPTPPCTPHPSNSPCSLGLIRT